MGEFEKKKQELIKQIDLVYKEDSKFYSEQRDHAVFMVKQLQPPAMPTCSTCKYLRDTVDEWPRCNAWRGNQAISDMTDNDISDPEKMGCIHHSTLDNQCLIK